MASHLLFDRKPGWSGPARYVGALVAATRGSEWSLGFVERELPAVSQSKASEKPKGAATSLPPRSTGILRQLTPRMLRLWLGFYRDARRYAGRLRQVPTDLFHTQNAGCEEIPLAARLAKVPRVLGTFHVDSTYDLEGRRSGWAHRAIEWYSNRCLDRAIAVSEATRADWIRRTRLSPERVLTIHNGIDPEYFRRVHSPAEARGRLGLPADALVIGGVGRLEPAKGFVYLLEALAALKAEYPRVVVAVAGAGQLEPVLLRQAQELGLQERVFLLGFQPDVNPVLDACDVFALPSLCEALPFALLEAMAHELPVVGTTVGGVPEVIVSGETGFLTPPRDSATLAQRLRPLLDSSTLRQRLGHAARDRVIRHFHVANMVRSTLAVYRDLLSQPARKGSRR